HCSPYRRHERTPSESQGRGDLAGDPLKLYRGHHCYVQVSCYNDPARRDERCSSQFSDSRTRPMTTPARRQYLDIKAQHQDAILLYQIGDFFETFDEDARIAARELQIVLTRRSYGPDEVVPLAGVPVHAVDNYAAKLLAKGYRVAICEQVAPP